ncbi:hypothetical protein Pst134EB_025213 [Puccinia striiformis f. sp. tritici]|nr:hypothetical protein Pst134EB_025213 [Puccinia striiformis f. sp. tritici]
MTALASQRPDPQSKCRVSYAERITDQLFPSREEMAAQTTAELDLHRDCLDNDSRMVDANIQLVNALSQQLAPTGPPAGTSHLQQRQLELDAPAFERSNLVKLKQLWQRNKPPGGLCTCKNDPGLCTIWNIAR